MIRSDRFAALLLGSLLASSLVILPALAAGDESSAPPTCKKGEIYDKKLKKCVKQQGANISDEDRADYAYALAKADRFTEALEVLDTVKDQTSAEVLNYRGYATRKLGKTDEGIAFYLQSVKKDPSYAKVREYLGEAYMVRGQIDLARNELQAIKSICGTDCEEYRDLDAVIQDPSKI